MNELTLKDLEKLDTIEITAEQNTKIYSWINKNKDMINVDNIFDKVVFRIINEEDYYYLIYFEFHKEELVVKSFKGHYSLKNPIHLYNANTNFTIKDYVYFVQERYDLSDLYINVTYEKYFFNENISCFKNEEEMASHTQDNIVSFIMWYFNILAYSQCNEESIIRETRTHTKKVQSKKDKRAGKKAKVKLIKQNIIRINTDHIEPPTEEEKREYERHISGWTVRGHWREYKSGKRIWIKPQVRGDKEHVEGKIYEID